MDKYFNTIKELLIKNGFNEVKKNKYYKNECVVDVIIDNNNAYYAISDEEGSMYSDTIQIYWLIGVLVYKGYIKNFKNL